MTLMHFNTLGAADRAFDWAGAVVSEHRDQLQSGDNNPTIGDYLFYATPEHGENALALLGLKLVTDKRGGYTAVYIERLSKAEESQPL